ncbi:MAG: hypothetical protein ACD_61C00291G0005 [uncultured bacterium]|nr:MAG: hypothetical protein ACD_61C00291G0005 [uncultured bacterium]
MTGEIKTEKLNLEEVGRHFESLGYKVRKLDQPWRHVRGEISHENERLFLKLACTEEIGERTRNERGFNENANSVWKKYLKCFTTPKIFDEGYYLGKYWFVDEFVFGKPLAEPGQKKTSISEKDLEAAAKIAKNIMELTDISLLPKDKEYLKTVRPERLLEMSEEWSSSSHRDTKKLLRFIKERKGDIEIAASHGDFTPWAIMKTKSNNYYLIDSEAAQMGGLKFYDVAYFYHRVYTKLKRPDLAETFLDKFKQTANWTEKNTKEFAPVLAGRIMGGYFDAERDGVTSTELNQEMEKNLLS